ncbi:MAG: hypothetical protein J6A75_13715 [Lachnospiraceae bacterium]|nr:hypothetical protein [Lachnospiraceae bacterium]
MGKIKMLVLTLVLALAVVPMLGSISATFAEEADIRYSPGYCPVWDSTDFSAEPIGEISGINTTFLLLETVEDKYAIVRTSDGTEGYVPLQFCQLTTPLEPAVAGL